MTLALEKCLDISERNIHMVGIGGIGMAGLAGILQEIGHMVSGSDLQSNELTSWLEKKGITFYKGHDSNFLPEQTDVLIRTPAVKDSNIELQKAYERGIPIFSRGEVLAYLSNLRNSIAVAGSHGKTTTTAMIIQMLEYCGVNFGYFTGGEIPDREGVSHWGTGDVFVTEADESDGTLSQYAPEIGVITNIEFDHLEYFKDRESFLKCFETFGEHSKTLILSGDDPECRLMSSKYSHAVSFRSDDEISSGIALPVMGRHNLLNARGAVEVGIQLGLAIADIVESLHKFIPVKRRFETIAQKGNRIIISDYAHHPTEIRTVIENALTLDYKRLIGIFQPHRFSRTRLMKTRFPAAFSGLDKLILCPVYAASETPLEGGESKDLAIEFVNQGYEISCVSHLQEAWEMVQKDWREGDAILIIGAGDVEKIGEWAVRDLGK